MIDIKDLKIDKKVYWKNDYQKVVSSGTLSEIKILKKYILCKTHVDSKVSHDSTNLYETFEDAEIALTDALMLNIKKEIRVHAEQLKRLRKRRSDALIIKLAGIDK